eukprot:scaffold90888_cov30-Phaeocystis_antarctica.AAC.1
MSWRSEIAGTRCLCGSAAPVIGEVLCVRSHRSMATRSKVWPRIHTVAAWDTHGYDPLEGVA